MIKFNRVSRAAPPDGGLDDGLLIVDRPEDSMKWRVPAFWAGSGLFVATAAVGVIEVWLQASVLVLYVVIIAGITAIFGVGWGMATAVIALLLSAYLFIPPRLELVLDGSVFLLAAHYFGCVLICFLVRMRWRGMRTSHPFRRTIDRYTPSNN